MQYAFAHQGRPQGLVKWLVLIIAMVTVIAGYSIYSWMQKDVSIVVDGKTIQTQTFKATVSEVLEEKGIKLNPKDLVKPGVETRIAQNQEIVVARAVPISIKADGKTIQVVSAPVPVGEILALAKVTLGDTDVVEPGLTAVADGKSVINVSRITEKIVTNQQEIAYRIDKKEDATLERGIRRVVSRGITGLKEETLKVTYKDGVKIAVEVMSTKIMKEPVNEVVAYGVIQVASRGGQRFEFDRVIEVRASAYTYTGSCTSTGTNPRVGTVAVDPSVIPLGSKLYIDGYGYGRAEDTGGAIQGNNIDVFLETKNEALYWGRKTVKVYILK